jgi:hypothetical protein
MTLEQAYEKGSEEVPMKAAVYYENGDPSVLKYEDVPDPVCHPRGIVIRVEAVSIEGGDTLNRLRGPLVTKPHIVGYQAAGEIIEVGSDVTHLKVGQKVATSNAYGSHAELLMAAARLAQRGPLLILDGGNRCNAYTLARATAGRADLLRRISLARAFTCYQMAALLEETAAGDCPLFLLDFLATFYDEAVSSLERHRLLSGCLDELARLSRTRQVAVSACPPAVPGPENLRLLARLRAAAGGVWENNLPLAAPQEWRLF